MPSPFPGMDPYLESPYIWPELHHRFASNLSGWLNQRLPKPYYARLEMPAPELEAIAYTEPSIIPSRQCRRCRPSWPIGPSSACGRPA